MMQTRIAPALPAKPATLPGSGTPTASPENASTITFDQLYIRHPRVWLGAILVAYLVVASQFAIKTPAWQVPDEPAHYNYVAEIAGGRGLPVLRMGDYDQDHLNLLLSTRFDPALSVSPLRYESYQPPLTYLLLTPIFWLSEGSLLSLRLFGVLMGMATILLLYLCLELVFPLKTLIPVGAAAFSALLPMHVAMSASVNNDGLAELLLMASMLVLLQWMRNQFYAADNAEDDELPGLRSRSRRQLLLLGILLGLGLLTKIYAYVLLPIVLLTVVVVLVMHPRVYHGPLARPRQHLRPNSVWHAMRRSLWVLVPALALGVPLWIRNMRLYGGWDVLGLAWHDQVVVGQIRTADWIVTNGWVAFGERAFSFTFKSFWGVFGWMGVFMDERIYTVLLLFTGVIFLGVLWATVRFISGGPDMDMDLFQISVLGLFGVIVVAVTASYLWYNVKFLQHQGRYFFWGILPIGTVVALGWREVLQPLQGAITGLLAAVLAMSMALAGYVSGSVDKWTVLFISLIALLLLLQPLLLGGTSRFTLRWLPKWAKTWMSRPTVSTVLAVMRAGVWALPFLLLFLLDLAIPNLFVIPQLGG